jgi:type I restriction enzyme, S subunit
MSELRRIGSFAKVRRGASPRPIWDPQYFGGNVGWVRIVDVTKYNYKYLRITEQYLSPLGQSKSVTVDKGDLIMSICATVGKPIIVDMAACIHDGFVQLYDLTNVDTEYLFYQLQFHEKAFESRGQPGTQVNLNTKIVEDEKIWLPDGIEKQKKIAKIMSTIDRTITHTEALIEKYQQIKAGLMHDLFTRGIGADGQLRPTREQAPELYWESAIGWIPKGWQFELLDKLAQRGSGHTPNKNIDGYWNGGVKWVSLADSRKLDKLYISDTDLEISELGIQNSSANIHPLGTVIMTRDAGVGKSAIISEPMAVSQHFMAWRCAEKMDNHFLYYWLQHKKRMFENVAMGSTIVTIGLPYFKRLKIAAPKSILEQKIVSEKLRSTDTLIFSLKSELEKLKYRKSGLMHDLLTGKVQVTIEDPDVTHD